MSASIAGFNAPRLHLVNEQRVCAACESAQQYNYCTPGRLIMRLHGAVWVTAQTVWCNARGCPLRYRPIHPPEEWAMAPPAQRFGFDVIAQVGQLRQGEKLTRPLILQRLRDEYPRLVISERSVGNLYTLYGELVSGSHLEDAEIVGRIKSNRVMVVGLDGGQPIKGHETVWFARDLVSGLTLAAEALRSTTANDLARLLEPVREFSKRHGVPVVGVISDAESNARNAVKKMWPRVPHQLCQLHYTTNLAKPLLELDSTARKELRKPFRQLRTLERALPKVACAESLSVNDCNALEGLFLTIRSIIKDNGRPPFDPPGIKLFDRLVKLRQKVRAMARQKGGPSFARSTSCSALSTKSPQMSSGFAATMRTSTRSAGFCSRRDAPRKAPSGFCATFGDGGSRSFDGSTVSRPTQADRSSRSGAI
jgi:hypothetical protein